MNAVHPDGSFSYGLADMLLMLFDFLDLDFFLECLLSNLSWARRTEIDSIVDTDSRDGNNSRFIESDPIPGVLGVDGMNFSSKSGLIILSPIHKASSGEDL